MSRTHPLFDRLRQLRTEGPVVVAHRGDSLHHPENTLAAFRAAADCGAPMQEFDVRATHDGQLVCIHDATFDRTTDSALRFGPGALVAQTTLTEARRLDAGSWFDAHHAEERVPTLDEALAVMLPRSIPLIEHKAGEAPAYVDTLRRLDALAKCILQSFDWRFVAAAHALAPELALAVLGPNEEFATLDAAAVAAAALAGAGTIHWDARSLRFDDVKRVREAGMLLVTYTTDDDLGWAGGSSLGLDAMCTNDPMRMMQLRSTGRLRNAGA